MNLPVESAEAYAQVIPPMTPEEVAANVAHDSRITSRLWLAIIAFAVGGFTLFPIATALWSLIASILLLAVAFSGFVAMGDRRKNLANFKEQETTPLTAEEGQTLIEFASSDAELDALLRRWYSQGRRVNLRAFNNLSRIAKERQEVKQTSATVERLAQHFQVEQRA